MGPDWGTVGTPVGSAAFKLNGQDERDMSQSKGAAGVRCQLPPGENRKRAFGRVTSSQDGNADAKATTITAAETCNLANAYFKTDTILRVFHNLNLPSWPFYKIGTISSTLWLGKLRPKSCNLPKATQLVSGFELWFEFRVRPLGVSGGVSCGVSGLPGPGRWGVG